MGENKPEECCSTEWGVWVDQLYSRALQLAPVRSHGIERNLTSVAKYVLQLTEMPETKYVTSHCTELLRTEMSQTTAKLQIKSVAYGYPQPAVVFLSEGQTSY